VATPALLVRWQREDEPTVGAFTGDALAHEMLQIELRDGATASERIYCSSGPLPTDEHAALIDDLSAAMEAEG
jgi:hypothetical protein